MDNNSSLELTNYDWIGQIPSDWVLKKFKYIFKEKKSTKNNLLNSGSISFGEVIYKNDDKITELTKNSYQEVLNGEFLINPLNLNFDLKSLRIGLSKIDVVVSQGYIILKLNKGFCPDYYKYLLRKFDVEYMKSLGQGVRQTISFNDIKDEYLVIPPLTEQKIISNFLNQKTQKIDLLIKNIEKKIELLDEQKTSLINQYVTKGLDPNVEMQDCEIQSYGRSPKKWSTFRLKYLFTEVIGGSWGDDPKDGEQDWIVRVIRVSEFDMEKLIIKEKIPTLRSFNIGKSPEKFVIKDDLILEKSGGGEKTPVGRIVLVNKEVISPTINSNFTCLCRAKVFVNSRFLLYALNNFYNIGITKKNIKQTTGIQNLDIDGYMNMKISIPKKEEQTLICIEIEKKSNRIDKIIRSLEKKIFHLKEYRHSLISSVVTGKIRVTEDMI